MPMNPTQAAAARDQALAQIANEHKAMKQVVEHLPENQLAYKPHEKIRTFSELAHHIYATGPWFNAIIENGTTEGAGSDSPKTTIETKAALLDACNRLHEEFIGKAKGFPPEKLAREVTFYDFGAFPAVSFLDWHLRHLIHHRGQLTVYLRAMGAKVPRIYGDSLDYPM